MLHSDGDRFCRRYRVYTYTYYLSAEVSGLKMYTSARAHTHTLKKYYIHVSAENRKFPSIVPVRFFYYISYESHAHSLVSCYMGRYELMKYNNETHTSERYINLLL